MQRERNVVIVGATGMVGGLALRQALGDPRVGRVTVITRRPTGLAHRRLREILHDDFLDFGGLVVLDRLRRLGECRGGQSQHAREDGGSEEILASG